jgi:hypothetical protein
VPSIKAGINKKQQKTKSKTNDVIQKANQVMSQVTITPETKKQLKLVLYPANKEVESEMLPVFVPITSVQETKINRHDNSVIEYESIEENQKKIKKHAYQIYATPSIGFRSSIRSAEPVVNSSMSSIDQGSIESYHQLPDLNLEAGGSFFFKLNKNFRLKAGMQFNYSRYQTQSELTNQTPIANAPAAAENGNPIPSSDLNNPAMGQFAEQVNHRSYQISLPIGTEFEVAGNGRLQWIAGATIQPGYQFASHQPTLSSALNKQTPTPSNVGKWNLNTSVETYLSYTLKSGAALIAGPQLRYQLLSMYQKNFIFDERLFNFGMKIGLMRNF